MAAHAPGQESCATTSPTPERVPGGPGRQIVACFSFTGECVVNAADEELGVLEHAIVDLATGRIAYGILARGGVFGLGEKLYAVPWSAFAFDDGRKCLIAEIEPQRLEHAPSFHRESWPSMNSAEWARDVHAHYDAPAYRSAQSAVQ